MDEYTIWIIKSTLPSLLSGIAIVAMLIKYGMTKQVFAVTFFSMTAAFVVAGEYLKLSVFDTTSFTMIIGAGIYFMQVMQNQKEEKEDRKDQKRLRK